MAQDRFLVLTFCTLTVLVVMYPLARYLLGPWAFRRDRLFALLADGAICHYYRQFRPGATVAGKPATDPSLTDAEYMQAFSSDFSTWYGRRYYALPLVALGLLSCISAYWTARTLQVWIEGGQGMESMHGLVAASLAGAFMWIISDETDRMTRIDFTSTAVLYYVFRILLAVPFGWALTRMQLTVQVGIPTAFFLGAFPTTSLFIIARRLGTQSLGLGESPAGTLELQSLQAIGKDNAEKFKDMGISTIVQLAYADPVELTIRTNLDFIYVVDCVSQALLWFYIPQTEALNVLSLRGAQEVAALYEGLSDPKLQAQSEATLKAAAAKLGVDEQALRTTFYQITLDPYTQFLVNAYN